MNAELASIETCSVRQIAAESQLPLTRHPPADIH
jgi:hypothetical protein